MKSIEIKGELRESLGKKSTKNLRKKQHVPCVLYGGEKNVHFSVFENDFIKLFFTPNTYLLDIVIGEKTYKAILQDAQFHPVTDGILHVDFLEIAEDKAVKISIPIHTTGFAKGVKEGGKLQQDIRKIKVKALPGNLPDFVEVDVTNVGVGQSIKIGDLQFENLELLDPKSNVVAAVKVTRAAKSAGGEEEMLEGEAEETPAPAAE